MRRRPPRPGAALRAALLVLAGAVILGGVLWGWQRRLVYFPAGAPPPVDQVLPGGREVTIATEDGLELTAWLLLADATAGHRPPGAVVLPGNAGNRAGRAPLARALADGGVTVLLVDYRGYGGNPGTPTEAGLLADATAAATWLSARDDVGDLVFVGESLGGALAVRMALDLPPAALVLRSPFSSLGDVARLHYGPVPDWALRDRFPVEGLVGRLETPILVVAGDRDDIVPLAMSRRVFEAAREPKRFVVVEGAGHNDGVLLSGEPFVGPVLDFVAHHTDQGPRGGD